jgi:hypothetical protein
MPVPSSDRDRFPQAAATIATATQTGATNETAAARRPALRE